MPDYTGFAYPLGLPQRANIGSTPEQHQQRALGNWQSDRAADASAPLGTPVYAVTSGTISPRGWGFGYNDGSGNPLIKGWKMHLAFDDGSDVAFYQHLSELAPGIEPGAHVEKGQLLGYSGEAGEEHTPHLHISLRNGDIMDLLNQAELQQSGATSARGEIASFSQELGQVCDSIMSSIGVYSTQSSAPFSGFDPTSEAIAPYTGSQSEAGGEPTPYTGETILPAYAPYTGMEPVERNPNFCSTLSETTNAVGWLLAPYLAQTGPPRLGAGPTGGSAQYAGGPDASAVVPMDEPTNDAPEPNFTPPDPERNFTPAPELNFTPAEPFTSSDETNFTPPDPQPNLSPAEPTLNFTPADEPNFTPADPESSFFRSD